MNKDFTKYQTIIDQFRGQVSNSDFEAKFAAATKHVPKTERFLLKMELKRLGNPCTRLVDLRGHVDGECHPYQYEQQLHFFDDIAIKVFEENIAYYGGYTFGVYEAVKNTENNFRVIYQREKEGVVTPEVAAPAAAKVLEKTQYPAQLFQFGPYHDRGEERMNFSIQLQVMLENKQVEEAISSDISVNGCKFRYTGSVQFQVGQLINIRFIGLGQEFQFGKDDSFSYEIRNIQTTEKIQLIGVVRIYIGDETRDGFKRFLAGFIQGNKRRYKINMDNTLSALQSRSFEQFSLPKSNELPVFIENQGETLFPRYALTCHNNQSTFQYWQDENHQSTLYSLLNKERLARLVKANKLGKSLLVYSFIHKSQGKYFFYSADEQQLNEDKNFKRFFLGFAASKDTFAISDLSLITIDSSRAESPLTLADSVTNQFVNPNTPISDEIKTLLADLTFMVVVSDITSSELTITYRSVSYEGIDTGKLKTFGHKRLVNPVKVDEIGINYKNQRQEPRFIYNTPVVVEIENLQWRGKSHDFSTSGLKIELDKSVVLVKGDLVQISFPNLQKITAAFELKRLPYEVMRINKKHNIVNLRVYVEQHQHIGRAFFKALIEKNRDKLTSDEYAMMSPGLTKALRNIYSSSLTIPSMIVQTSGSRYKIEALTCGQTPDKLLPHMLKLSDRAHFYNLYPILNNIAATSLIMAKLKKMLVNDAPISEVLYIAINPDFEMIDKAVTTKLASELGSDKITQLFIKNALKRGYFFCIKAMVSRVNEPDMDYLNPELSYISSYAIHRGKQIEQDIWSVAGVIQLFDITQEALMRYELLSFTQNEAISSHHS